MVRGCSDMPEAVLEEIFSWLPPDSLISFKCVSKSWTLPKPCLSNDGFVVLGAGFAMILEQMTTRSLGSGSIVLYHFFDVFGEVFRNIPLPDSLQFDRLKLAVWNESVALFRILKLEGFQFQFLLKFGYWMTAMEVLRGLVLDKETISYNLDSQLLRNLTVSEFGRIGRWDFSYVKTLVSVEVFDIVALALNGETGEVSALQPHERSQNFTNDDRFKDQMVVAFNSVDQSYFVNNTPSIQFLISSALSPSLEANIKADISCFSLDEKPRNSNFLSPITIPSLKMISILS
ncbi:hypothetical protein F8388_015308 [Cannabis sativa]|uniref:F-box domain-containing protein n=1 Tax=Cannabis sativa TaxID=3483 RepID=A0A7J6F1M9_CANSA|nr:hypothetical protein F8388_015308 [Cannabis sativa]